jgi:glycine/D-amino acid oxidase-like deaminating enzyme
MKPRLRVVVAGAGAMGGWTALYLLRRGARVTLADAWGPGNSRSSSGGETRVIRGTYGPDQPYTALAARSLRLWREHERRWKRQFLHRIGVLWMAKTGGDAWEAGSLEQLKEARIPFQRLSPRQLAKRWPQVNFEGVGWAVFEPESGFLTARAACRAVAEAFLADGGRYLQAAVGANDLDGGKWQALSLSAASTVKETTTLRADRYVFACGPWLGRLFPHTIGGRIRSTKQDVFFFGTPPGDSRFDACHLPVWADHQERFLYGIPGNEGRGFKIADDTRGPEFDPTTGEREVNEAGLKFAREYLAFRFPGMKNAPLVEARVCQYEQTPDSHFIIDRHPGNERVWLVGGGSGHGFKHGPALGEMVAKLVVEDGEPEPCWSLGRFAR